MYYRIEEVVTPQGHYIVLPGMYASPDSARAAIAKERHNEAMRVVSYVAGWTAERVEVVS